MSSASPDLRDENRDSLVFVFDFDGVVIDSVAALRKAYFQFLESFGSVGSEAEFQRLNGPKLPEIVSLLKRWHGLPPSEEELLTLYTHHIREHYAQVALFDGVRHTLEFLASIGIPTAIATASSRVEVEGLLSQEELLDAFAFIITGDEVETAKPNSDIYLRVKKFFSGSRCIVLEDSENGVKAALGAGLETVFFDPEQIGTSLPVTAILCGFDRFPGLLEEIRADCFTLALCTEAEIRIVPAPAALDGATEARISRIWENECRKRPLTDGEILCYAGHRTNGGMLEVDVFISKYRYFLARFQDQSIPVRVTPLGISGLLLDSEGKTLAARRTEVTEYPGQLELVPSGGMDVTNVILGRADFELQILEELEEETGICGSAVTQVSAFCLIGDAVHGVMDLGCVITLGTKLKNTFPSGENAEYRHFQVLSPEYLTADVGWVPVSGALLRNRPIAAS